MMSKSVSRAILENHVTMASLEESIRHRKEWIKIREQKVVRETLVLKALLDLYKRRGGTNGHLI